MIDLNNTWCINTEENYNELEKLGIKFVGDYCKNDKYLVIQSCFSSYDEIKDKSWFKKINKQVHLVNGEFQYVESRPKNNFKEYGFEADFEGEIKFIDSFNHFIGICEWSKEMPTISRDKQTVFWVNEKCFLIGLDSIKRIPSRDLKPIKKEWYLDKDNFEAYKGKIIINKYGNIRMIQSIDENKVSTFEQNMYHDILKVEEWKPATKEEVLSLLIEE